MKKLVSVLLAATLAVGCLVGCGTKGEESSDTAKVAMITDYGDITDQSFNQTTYEACKDYCDANKVDFQYYKPTDNSTEARVAMIEKAIEDGYNVIVMPGYAFGESIAEISADYKDIKFFALDVSEGDLGKDCYRDNVYCTVYQEELSGYMAGYAAVKLGYTQLGFLGGMAVPAVQRYGYGFVQGADAAAAEISADVSIKYAYGNQFYGDGDITAAMDTWYSNGTEVVFASGGGIFTSAAEAAAKVNGKVIGVDADQSAVIDSKYGEGLTVTSAMKGLYPTTKDTLKAIIEDGKWDEYKGKIDTLGLVSGDDPTVNYVQLPMETTKWSDGFTQDDYKALVADMFSGKIKVSNDISTEPTVSTVSVDYQGNIK